MFSIKLPQMTTAVDDRTENEKKTGRVMKGEATNDPLFVRQSMHSVKAMHEYDKYLKEYKSRMRQLKRIANGDMAPSSQSYK